ncbi:MAG TPA: peptidoglycan-binding protein [Clostridia bacterium]|nr:peptidoglycan-binding protein [Clostridia bacterium]
MLDKFVQYLETRVKNHDIYVWGAQGEGKDVITESWIRKKETSADNARRAIDYWKKQVAAGYGEKLRAFDCSGLGMRFLIDSGLEKGDMNSNAMMARCTMIKQEQLSPGDFVFLFDAEGRARHIGYVVDANLNVIEAKGRDYGVVKSSLKNWEAYGRPPYFRDAAGGVQQRLLRLATPYMTGADVKAVQSALLARGYKVFKADGIFGPVTDKAVRVFQADKKLAVDGVVGPKTRAALGIK